MGGEKNKQTKKQLNSTCVKTAGLYTIVCHTEGIYL